MEANLYRLRWWAKIAREDRGVLTFGPDEADAILAALERAKRVEKAARAYRRAWTRPGREASIQEIKEAGQALDAALEGP